MPIFTTQGWIKSAEHFKQICRQQFGVQNPTTQLFFIFPSNLTEYDHHTAKSTLYSEKQGGGLAKVAGQLGQAGIATLGLPTSNMPKLAKGAAIPAAAIDAVEKIWQAIGYGMKPVLPVRAFRFHQNPKNIDVTGHQYFSKKLELAGSNVEPSFYGKNENEPNIILGDYYIDQLNLMNEFLSLTKKEEIEAFLKKLPENMRKAYQAGVAAKTKNPKPDWYISKHPQQKAEQHKKDTPEQKAKQTKKVSSFGFGDWMFDTDVIHATQGFLSRHPDKIRGVLVKYFKNTLSTRNSRFENQFRQLIKEALLELDGTKSRIVFTVHIGGNHYATVAYDRNENRAVIIEPLLSSGYKKEINTISTLLADIFKEPGFTVESPNIKIQHDSWICGFISSKLADHFLTSECSLHEAIQQNHLPKVVLNLKNDDGRRALVKEVQEAHRLQTEKFDNIAANDRTALQAMTLGLLNLVATGQLDNIKFNATHNKLLAFYNEFLIAKNIKNKVAPPQKSDLTWDKFKAFVVSQDSEESQRLLANEFGYALRCKLHDNTSELNAFYYERLHRIFLNELNDFLSDKADDGQIKNYNRFKNVRKEFIRIRNDNNLKTLNEKINAFNNAWKNHRVALMYLDEIHAEREFPNHIDFSVMTEYFQSIDFNYGTKPNTTANYYTSGYGEVSLEQLNKIGVDTDNLIKDLCDNQNGILVEIASRDKQRHFQFKRLTADVRLEKLKAVLAKYPLIPACAVDKQATINKILQLVTPKSFHPTIKLRKENDQWSIIDTDDQHTWLKVKTLASKVETVKDQTKSEESTDKTKDEESPDKSKTADDKKKTNKLSAMKIDFTKPDVSMILKRAFGAMPNAQSISSRNYKVNGFDIQVFEDGFKFTHVTKEIIEATVKAMAAVFDEKKKTDKNSRVVKLTLSKEHEKFRSDYLAEIKKYNLILSSEKTAALEPENSKNKWQEHHKKMTEGEDALDDKENKKENDDSNKKAHKKHHTDSDEQKVHDYEPTLPVLNKPIGTDNGPLNGSTPNHRK